MRIFVPSAAELLTDAEGHGEGLIAWNFLSGLAERGHDLVVCAQRAALSQAPPFELIELGRGSRFESLAALRYVRAARRELERANAACPVDLVHWFYPGGEAHSLFVPPRGMPFVQGPAFAPWPVKRRRPLRVGDAIAAVLGPVTRARHSASVGAATMLVATPGALPRSRHLPIGIDLSGFTCTPPSGRKRILFVGLLDPAKGILELLDAFTAVRAALPDAELALAGDGPLRPQLEASPRPGVSVLGPVAHGRIPELMRDASLLCLPTHFDAYSMAILEAMASARAVVATDVPGPRFLVDPQRGGRMVAVGDAAALAGALVELLADAQALAELGAFNRGRVERELERSRILDRLEEIYAEVTR